MEEFMENLADTVWPPEKRISFCYLERMKLDGTSSKSCNAKEGNPFFSFWETFKIDFIESEFFGPALNYDVINRGMDRLWNERYSSKEWKVTPTADCVWKLKPNFKSFLRFLHSLERQPVFQFNKRISISKNIFNGQMRSTRKPAISSRRFCRRELSLEFIFAMELTGSELAITSKTPRIFLLRHSVSAITTNEAIWQWTYACQAKSQ